MRKLFLLLVVLFLTTIDVQAQSSMTDQQLITFILEERDKGSSQTEIVTKLMQRGVNIQQIQRVKRKYDRQIKQAGLSTTAEQAVDDASARMRKNNGQARKEQTTQMIGSNSTSTAVNPNSPAFIDMQEEQEIETNP